MADYAQNGVIGTLHNLRTKTTGELEAELADYSRESPMSLLLPCLFSELEGPAMGPIAKELKKATYLHEIIIGLDRADHSQYEKARRFFDVLPQKHTILWNDGPRLKKVDALLASKGIDAGEPGKGRNVWYCLGYFLAEGKSRAVALHDCDILTYDRGIPARLFYPLVHPSFNYQFCKGYYYRAAEGKLNGRVVRLLVAPMLRALQHTLEDLEYLDYMSSFRYPLAGEFSMRAEVVPSLRIPSDWGLEIGTLSEMYRNCNMNSICQVDIADAYDHKHQPLSEDNANTGLHRMANDICKALYRKLAIEGVVFSRGLFRTLKACYYRTALDMIDHYYNDAIMSGLTLDRHKEAATVELFGEIVSSAGKEFLKGSSEQPFVPSWSRVTSALPEVYEMLLDATSANNA